MNKLIFIALLLLQSCSKIGQLTVQSTTISNYKIKDKKMGGAKCSRYTEFRLKQEEDNYSIENVSITEACLDGYEIDTLFIKSASINRRNAKANIKILYKNKFDRSKTMILTVPLHNDTVNIGETVNF